MSRTTRARAARAIAPVAGLLAAGLLVWQGSYAAFSATTTNQNDAWSTGSLVLQNNGGVAGGWGTTTPAFINATNLNLPTAAASRCITVESTGSIAGSLRLYRGALTGGSNTTLAGLINLNIVAQPVGAGVDVIADCSNWPGGATTPIATNVSLNALPTTYAAATPLAVSGGTQRVAYRVTYNVASTGSTAGDNALQNTNATANFIWEMQ